MPLSLVRFNMVDPALDPAVMADRYRAMLDMAAAADQAGFFMATLEEHHGADNGWSPTPMLNAGMILARTKNLAVTISALLLPLHDPIRVAEDIAVIDLMSGGRLTTIFGLGYRESEYHLHGKDWDGRGALMDECIETVLAAWTGEPFEYRGRTVRVTPTPLTKPHPLVLLGGTSKIAARRAARYGLPMQPAAHMPELEAYYLEQCQAHGTNGFCVMPAEDTAMVFCSEDPDRTWAELGHHFLHEATTYASWQTGSIRSAVKSGAATVEDLRAEGIYQVLTPEECRSRDVVALHPLCGGMPVDDAWASFQLYLDAVA